MTEFTNRQPVRQLGRDRGGYYHVVVPATVVDEFPKKRKTRFLCTLEDQLTYPCGLNHLGDGNFFIIISGKRLKQVGKELDDMINFRLVQDPNPLGVEMPEVLTELLVQDDTLNKQFQTLTMGKKRHIIHSINRIKDIDKQVNKAIDMIRHHSGF